MNAATQPRKGDLIALKVKRSYTTATAVKWSTCWFVGHAEKVSRDGIVKLVSYRETWTRPDGTSYTLGGTGETPRDRVLTIPRGKVDEAAVWAECEGRRYETLAELRAVVEGFFV